MIGNILRQGIGPLARKITKDQILGSITKAGKSGAVGGVIDGFLGAAEGIKLYREGIVDAKTAAHNGLNEAACGFFTATAGTLGTTVATLALGSMGPPALVAGMAGSVGARWLYRANIASPLPDPDEELPLDEEDEKDLEELMNAIKTVGLDIPATDEESEKGA